MRLFAKRIRWFSLATMLGVFALVTAVSAFAWAQPKGAPAGAGSAAPDAAVLEVELPADAELSLDGAPQGARRTFEFKPFPSGAMGRYEVRVKLADGREQVRSVLLMQGWRVRASFSNAQPLRPGLVLQISHTGEVNSVAFSPDGARVLTGSEDKTAILWDASSGQILRFYRGHSGSVNSVAISPNGREILTGSSDTTAILWDAATGRRLRVFRGHKADLFLVAFSADGGRILTAGREGTAIVWNAATGDRIFSAGGGAASGYALSPNGQLVFADGKLWNIETGKVLRTIGGGASTAVFSRDGHHLLTAENHTIRVWDLARSGEPRVLEAGNSDEIVSADFSQNGLQVFGGLRNGSAIVWDLQSGQRERTFGDQAGLPPRLFVTGGPTLAVSPDGLQVCTGRDLWETKSGQLIRTLKGYAPDVVRSLALSRDGRRTLAGVGNGTAILWDARNGRMDRVFKGPDRFDASSPVAFTKAGEQVITAGNGTDEAAIIWDTTTGQRLSALRGKAGQPTSIAVSPDDRRVLTASWDHVATLWDAETGQQRKTFQFPAAPVPQTPVPGPLAVFSPDGRRALAAAWAGSATLWELSSGRQLRVFPRGSGDVAFTPDGRKVATVSPQGLATLWDAASGRKMGQFGTGREQNRITSLAFSSEGRRLLTGSVDNSVTVWDLTSGRMLQTLNGHSHTVDTVAFCPDGRKVISTSQDGTARLWDSATGDELVRLISLEAGKDWLVVTPEGLFDGSEGGREKVAFRVGEGLDVVPVDRFFQDFYRPGVLAEIEHGERPMPTIDLGQTRPPVVRIVAPAAGGVVDSNTVELVIEVEDQGGGIQGPWLHQNGYKIAVEGPAERVGKIVRRRTEVTLVEGENRLEAKAASGDGSWESEIAGLSFRYDKKAARPHLYVVSVGVSRYEQNNYRLRFAAADSSSFADLFRRRAPELYGDRVHIDVLNDDRATATAIRDAMKAVAARSRKQDTLMLFLAGHGVMIGQRYYFLPYEFHATPGAVINDAVRKQGIPADVLAGFLTEGQALKRVLILDTCASGGTVDLFQVASRSVPFSLQWEVERLARNNGIFVIAASSATEEAFEREELGHGILTYALLAGLRAVDRGPLERTSVQPSGGKVADVFEWFSFAAGHVPRLAKQFDKAEQNVHMAVKGASFPVLPIEDR